MCFVKGPKNIVVAHVLRVLPPQREARGDQEPAEAAAKVAGMHHPWAPNWRFIFSVWLSSITALSQGLAADNLAGASLQSGAAGLVSLLQAR